MSEYIRTPNPPLVQVVIPKGFAAFLDLAGKKCLGIKEFARPAISKSAAPVIFKPTRAELDAELAKRGVEQPAA
jgi:hypothetical protein